MYTVKKSRFWTMALVVNVIIAFAIKWPLVSIATVIVNALYVLWLVGKQFKEGLL